jgi:hypothetical protein
MIVKDRGCFPTTILHDQETESRRAPDLGLMYDLGGVPSADLGQLPGVTTHDLGTHRCTIVTVKIAGRSADDVAAALGLASTNVSITVTGPSPPWRGCRASQAPR